MITAGAHWTLDITRGVQARTRAGTIDYVQFDADGTVLHRTRSSFAPDDATVAAWAAAAPAAYATLAAEKAERAAAKTAEAEIRKLGAFRAKYRGTCATTGRFFRPGDLIFRTGFGGYALADERGIAAFRNQDLRDEDWLERAMDREDSIF